MRTNMFGTTLLVVVLILSFLISAEGKNFNLKDFNEKAPELLGSNNAGTEFWLTFNPAPETPGGKNELKLYVVSEFTTTVTALNFSRYFLEQKQIKPYEITEFTLTPYQGQCYSKSDSEPPQSDAVFGGCGEEYGIHVYADMPFICYAVTQYQNSGEGYLAIPVSSLGKEYIVSSWADGSDNITSYHPSYISIVSPYDNNMIDFTLGGTPGTKTKGGLITGNSCKFNLGKGNILLLASGGQGADFSGSRILSSKPVAVISGNYCANIPDGIGGCSFVTEMERPAETWGKTYIYTPIIFRKNNSFVKIFSKEAGTNIFRDNVQIATLKTAGGIAEEGWIKLRADESSPFTHIFSADKPINVVQFNCGYDDDSVESNPFMMELTPMEEFQNEIIFSTPNLPYEDRYKFNYINVLYQSEKGVLLPDDVQIASYEDSTFIWKKIGNLPNTLSVQTVGSINDKFYYFATIKLLKNGVYKIKADNPLTAYSYGFSDVDGYGFPASTSFSTLLNVNGSENEVDINLYPNPADDYLSFNFNIEAQKPDFIKLFDSFGNVVYENENIIENNIKINTSELASGMYFLRVGSMFMRKVVVVH
ncbi:MAG: T9SS type A sorting domain-containing protein [Bacteroidetes bacterium]|nr:MAG: T9SS type A sorting domain-containing protein [Bacteroidota bacterium]